MVSDIDLPKKAAEIGIIRRIFLDPTASHLIISTTLGENYYLHAQSRVPKPLSRLKGVTIDSVSWNPSRPTASTREILIGASDGIIYETFLELSSEFYRKDVKYAKVVLHLEGPITGIWTDTIPDKPDLRRVLISSPARLFHFIGRIGRHGHEGSGSIFARLFEAETPTVHDVAADKGAMSSIAVTPDAPEISSIVDSAAPERIFAWLNAQGTLHGRLLTSPAEPALGRKVLNEARNIPGPATFVALTQWHILRLVEGRIVALNRLDDSVVYSQPVLDGRQVPIALLADLKMNTFWLFASQGIYEIVVESEDRDVWKILLKQQKFEESLQHANSPSQKDVVATASGDHLMKVKKYSEAARVYGKSSKPFEEVAIAFIDCGQKDALRQYLLTKLSVLKKSATMQRVMIASWLTEVFMSKLDSLDDMVMTGAELEEDKTPKDVDTQLTVVRKEFQDFVRRYRDDLDKRTIYDIISSHGREDELLFFATTINDHNYVVSYWSQRENWSEALKALNKQTDPEIIYKYSSVLMAHVAPAFVEVLMRQSHVNPRKLIPAFLNYNGLNQSLPLKSNQAVRYLVYEINQRSSTDAAVHNTLISIYASHPSADESALLAYLEAQAPTTLTPSMRPGVDEALPYDSDFALRLCIQHSRIRACVHIYTTMGRYAAAVDLALQHQQAELAIAIAERPEHNSSAQKKLWLAIARSVISGPPSAPEDTKEQGPRGLAPKHKAHEDGATISTALALIQRAPAGILKIEDILPLFPDFVRVDAFKDEVCSALASYSAHIESLKSEMDASAITSARIAEETKQLGRRWVLLEPGESCGVCRLALLERRFWVWGCGHGAHGDCAARRVMKHGGKSTALQVREIRTRLEQGAEGKKRAELIREMDEIVGKECPLCGDTAIKMIDEPFVTQEDDKGTWRV